MYYQTVAIQTSTQNTGDRLLTTAEVAAILRLGGPTVRSWRNARNPRGPAWLSVAGEIRYRLKDVELYLKACTVYPQREQQARLALLMASQRNGKTLSERWAEKKAERQTSDIRPSIGHPQTGGCTISHDPREAEPGSLAHKVASR